MENNEIRNYLSEINKKLDLIVQEIDFQKKHRQELEDLKEDLTRVGKNIYETAVYELEEVHDYIKTGDIYFLFKKILRNINNLTRLFEQIENIRDFIQDFGPVSKELFVDIMHKFDEFDRKGYFKFLKDISKIFDVIVANYSKEEIEDLIGKVESFIQIFKKVSQQETIDAINNLLNSLIETKPILQEKVSFYKVYKELKKPEVKKGILFTLEILKNFTEFQQKTKFKKGE
ncbi:MAG: DUF1641 domain-containing protein [Ignavibacteria bacterium]|nr:DUF1641 domain-containing protein [Ignavibacteria bacterium]